MKAHHRLTGLDGLRAIAALGVLLHHFSEHASRLVPELFFAHPVKGVTGVLWPFQVGAQGVTLFFIISGFVILNSLMRCKRGVDFAFGRFSRLYPLFWFAVCVTTAVRLGLSQDDVSLRNFLANLTMVPTLWSESIIDGVYWTLIVELKFYLLAYLVWRFKGLERIETVCAAWLSLTVVNQLLLQRGLVPELTHWATDWLILKHAPLFTCGIMLFSLHQRGSAPARWALLLTALALATGGGGPHQGWRGIGVLPGRLGGLPEHLAAGHHLQTDGLSGGGVLRPLPDAQHHRLAHRERLVQARLARRSGRAHIGRSVREHRLVGSPLHRKAVTSLVAPMVGRSQPSTELSHSPR